MITNDENEIKQSQIGENMHRMTPGTLLKENVEKVSLKVIHKQHAKRVIKLPFLSCKYV